MKPALTRDQLLDYLPAYVLGALEPAEMFAVENFLRHHPDAEVVARLRELEEVTLHLAQAVPEAPLPARLRTEFLDRVRADQPLVPSPTGPILSPGAPRPAPASPPPPARARSWLQRLLGAPVPALGWAALGALLVLLLGAPYVSDLRAEHAAALEQMAHLEALREENRVLQQQLSHSQELWRLLAMTRDQVPLRGTEAAPGAGGAFYLGGEAGVLVLQGLPPLAVEQTYQLWLIDTAGTAVPVGLVPVTGSGATSITVALPPDAADYATVGVSVEPAGGSRAPTGPVVMVGQVDGERVQ